ncbi:hypothetical protein [Sphingomonas sp. RS2018]
MPARLSLTIALALTACASGTAAPPASGPIAIYSPPVRLGGTGSMIFLPGTPANARDEVAVIATLHRWLDQDGTAGCLAPLLEPSGINASIRKGTTNQLRADGNRRPMPAAVRASIIADQRGSWGDVAEPSVPLSAALEDAVTAAYADAAMAAPRTTRATMLVAGDVPGIALKTTCIAHLDRPTIRGDWAFVGRRSATAGHLYALRRDGDDWTVVAHRFTYIA